MLARIVRLVTAVVVGFIVVGILLHVLDANSGNALVSFVHDVAGWLVTPFEKIFKLDSQDAQIAVNWGLAALVYAILGSVIASILARFAVSGRSGRAAAV